MRRADRLWRFLQVINKFGLCSFDKIILEINILNFFATLDLHYSSGNDLTQDLTPPTDNSSIHQPLIDMVEAFIRFPKLLIAIVNGPAIGIGGTVLALCDIVYAAENAYIYTPFTNLGLCAEGCSSVTFPKILGTSKANEMLMLNHKLSAQEAREFGLVAFVYKDVQEVWKKLEQIGDLPIGSIIANKKLTRKFTIKELEEANRAECVELGKRFESPEAFEAMVRFQQSRKNKSSKL